MGQINYKAIYELNKDEWKALTREPQKYEALLAGHYSDSNHFVYELLQNAEDAKATKVVFEYYNEKLVFYHNGKPFDENDVKGVSSMLMGTKDLNSAQTIGKFGMGFKSVYKYTYQPEIYSDNEAFHIINYLLPEEIKNGWSYNNEKKSLVYPLNSKSNFLPFINDKHLTKIIIPFAKKDSNANIVKIKGDEVLKKLKDLNGEILLFLKYIKKLYWIDKTIKNVDKYALISLDESNDDINIKSCRIEGTDYGSKEEISKYIKFSKIFDHPDMKDANVSVAFKINARATNINEINNTKVWVYFPTKDEMKFPFLIHGSFETAVSREKLMEPSVYNEYIFDKLGDLICDSLLELRDRNLITQMFIRRILLVAMQDERISNLRERITNTFCANNLLPDKSGNYKRPDELCLAVPFEISDFTDKELFKDSFFSIKPFVQLNNAKEINYTEYYTWLIDDLHINVFDLESWANKLKKFNSQKIEIPGEEYESIKEFYRFISEYKENSYIIARSSYGNLYMRSGPYEKKIRECLEGAWKLLRKSALILNANGKLVAAYKGNKENIYLNSSSQYKNVIKSSLVDKEVADEFETLFKDGFHISDFNNFQYIKEKVVKKYINIEDTIKFDNSNDYEDEYVEDIKQIIELIEETHENKIRDIHEMLKNAYIIKIIDENGDERFALPKDCYTDLSLEGINLEIYYKEVTDKYYRIDFDFYNNKEIPMKKLQEFGLVSTVIDEGIKYDSHGPGNESWKALGEYCPFIEIDCLEENIEYIERNPDEDLSKEKSAEILKLLLKIYSKLIGTVCRRKSNPYYEDKESKLLEYTIKPGEWLYNKNEELCSTTNLSKYDLNTTIYGQVIDDKDAYATLGFIEKDLDKKVEAYEFVYSMEEKDQKILLQQLARKYGMSLTEEKEIEEDDEIETEDGYFNPNEWVSKDFPAKLINNRESLVEHVRQEFFCADPIKYHKVWRQLRASKNHKTVRSYAMGMYTNESNVRVCQMCKEPIEQVEVTAIANFGIEMNQLNLCLCRNCAGKYKMLRDRNKEIFKNEIKEEILCWDVDDEYSCGENGEYEIAIDLENSLNFTQTHLAEVQTIFKLLEKYGLPSEDQIFETVFNELELDFNGEEIASTT
jgi:hypothetical protein